MAEEIVEHYTPSDIARKFMVSAQCVRSWENSGKIPPATRTLGGHRRFTSEHVAHIESLLKQNAPVKQGQG